MRVKCIRTHSTFAAVTGDGGDGGDGALVLATAAACRTITIPFVFRCECMCACVCGREKAEERKFESQISNAMCVKNNYPMMKPVGRRSERV